MKKKPFGIVLSGALALGVLAAVPAFAEEPVEGKSPEKEMHMFHGKEKGFKGKHFGFGHHPFHKMNKGENLLEAIEQYDIETEGKTLREVAKEVREVMKDQFEELGIVFPEEEMPKENRDTL